MTTNRTAQSDAALERGVGDANGWSVPPLASAIRAA